MNILKLNAYGSLVLLIFFKLQVAKKKSAPSRREELLKQLKAVEDAIARKRSKI